MPNHRVLNTIAASLALVFTLSGCGGGEGGGAADAAPTLAAPAPTAPATVAALVPGNTMTWATAAEKAISLSVQAVDGQPAAGAAVRVFTVTRASPHDGSPLEEPVPVSLLDTVVTDAAGRTSITLLWPGHANELLVVATLHDTQDRAVLNSNTDATVALRLAR